MFSEMEWNSKWDWENIVGFGSSTKSSSESEKKVQWMIVDDGGEIHNAGLFNLSGSDSDRFRPFQGSRVSSPSVGSVEPVIGLRLGKRTYFENSSSSTTSLSSSSSSIKKSKSSGGHTVTPRCQVEGCNAHLSMAKEYHRKHRVCDSHSKCSKVVVGGLERRFCQQCSRFHSLSEFDENKRSCRKRLSDHNARRRKPHQETIQFNSTRRFPSPFYGGSQQMSFLLNNAPANSTWDNSSKFTLTRGGGYPSKSTGDEPLHMQGLPHVFNNCTSEVLNPGGSKGPTISSSVDAAAAAPEYRRALSLLSNSNSWDSSEAIPLQQPIPQGVPLLSSSDFWLTGGQTSTNPPHLQTNTNFQEIQLSKTPYDGDFYSSMLN